MLETPTELAALQQLLDRSVLRASAHLTSIISGERRLTAAQLVQALPGMKTLSIATVTASCEPRVSGVDGHFLHGRWLFTTAGTARKAAHLRARPAVSVAHLQGDDLGVFTHGQAVLMAPHEVPAEVEGHLVAHYGSSPTTWGDDIVYCWVEPSWMVGYAFDIAKLLRPASP